ncbi:MAG: HypC/HybG/HupF family hydrogenase formation chaperone [Gammaproteobacteria bacterium]|nr:HypC/HybG/HupF family hydrogenase formation chaperone [Gammaproteobacteria bacterium]
MCLAIPMQIVEIDGYVARCEARGVQREVSLFMLQDEELAVDDFVMVHVGYAIQKVTEKDARSSWELFDEILVATENGTVPEDA